MKPGRLPPRRLRIALGLPSGTALFERIQKGFLDHAGIRGQCSLIRLPDLANPSVRWLQGWQGDGAIIAVTSADEARIARRLPFPVVNIASFVPTPGIPVVTVDNEAVGRCAAQHLLKRRFVRFGFFGMSGMEFSRRRGMGMRAEILQAGGQWTACAFDGFFSGRAKALTSDRRLEVWLKKLSPPVGILAANDFLAVMLIEACQRLSLRVPEDIAVVGVDNDTVLCEMFEPAITSISRNDHEVGFRAMKLLLDLIAGHPLPPGLVLVPPGSLVQRRSSMTHAVAEPRVAAAVQFLNDHIDENFGVEVLAQHAGLSRRRLEYHFRRELGCTPKEFIDAERVERAKQLLTLSQDLTLTAVSRRCGFPSLLRFRATFRQATGRSPAEFRAAGSPSGAS